MAADESEDQFVPLSNERPYSERIVTIKSIIWGEGGGGRFTKRTFVALFSSLAH